MKRTLGLILIIGAMVLGYLGIRDLGSSSTSVDILGIELSAEDNKAKEMAYVKIGLGVVASSRLSSNFPEIISATV